MKPSPHAQGMTLIEAMVAIAILAIVTTMIWGGFTQTARNKSMVEDRINRRHEVSSALERMAREVSMAYVSAHANPNPTLQTVVTAFIGDDNGETDRLDFTSFSHRRLYRNAHESDQNELSYFITAHPHPNRRGEYVLARREQNRVDDDPRRGGRVEILAERVQGLDISYLDPLSGEWLSSWNTTQGATGQPNRLPAQVKFLLTVDDPSTASGRRTYGTRSVLGLRWALNFATYN